MLKPRTYHKTARGRSRFVSCLVPGCSVERFARGAPDSQRLPERTGSDQQTSQQGAGVGSSDASHGLHRRGSWLPHPHFGRRRPTRPLLAERLGVYVSVGGYFGRQQERRLIVYLGCVMLELTRYVLRGVALVRVRVGSECRKFGLAGLGSGRLWHRLPLMRVPGRCSHSGT